jgi:hypothetical protein
MAVYFIQRPNDGAIKIGHTTEFKARFDALEAFTGMDLTTLCILDKDRKFEKEMHEKFNNIRLKGEWFKSDKLLLDYIDSLNTQSVSIDSDKIKRKGRSVSVRFSKEDEKLFDAEKERRKGISDSQLAREILKIGLHAIQEH